jgi:enoyl-CoA hydratase/carnithine racemase
MPAAAHVTYPAENVGLIVVDSPPRNFGSGDLVARILESAQAAEDAGCSVVVLASDTPGYFIAHWSLQALVDAFSRPPAGGRPRRVQPGIFDVIETIPMFIAANNGAWGGARLSWLATCASPRNLPR